MEEMSLEEAIKICKNIILDDLLNCREGGDKEFEAIQILLKELNKYKKIIEKNIKENCIFLSSPDAATVQEKTADEMFEELDFEKDKPYENIISYENDKMEIEFWTDRKIVTCTGDMTDNILKAINKKCQEMKWI